MTYKEKIKVLNQEIRRILKEKHPEASQKQIEKWVTA